MGRSVKKILLALRDKEALTEGYHNGKSASYRKRCQMVLLKSEGYKCEEIGLVTGSCRITVNRTVNRYLHKGFAGLATHLGQGRKSILQDGDLATVKAAVQQERQRLNQAKKTIEENTGKKMGRSTLTRFLKLITAVTNE